MPSQFVVPQFIDTEDKILGPITARQFIIMLVAILICAIFYKLLPFVWFLVIGLPIIAVAGVVAFVPINGQPFHFFFLNLVQTFRRPRLRVWNKSLTASEIKTFLAAPPAQPTAPAVRKTPIGGSRLQELTLIVNTGGVYKPEED